MQMSFTPAMIAMAVFLTGLLGFAADAAEEPPHTVVHKAGAIEIRDYEPLILAEVDVSGDMSVAGNRGFRLLARYIFGDNQRPQGAEDAQIDMTSPVIQARSEKIAMTAPVTQQGGETEGWRVAFIMPEEWSMDTLPRPSDARIQLRQIPARRIAVISFAGGPNEKRFARKADELSAFLEREGYKPVGAPPIYARYDPPWVPAFLRRNEVMIEIAG